LFGSAPYFGEPSATKTSRSRIELSCLTATEIRWNKNLDTQTSPVISTNRLPVIKVSVAKLLDLHYINNYVINYKEELQTSTDRMQNAVSCSSQYLKLFGSQLKLSEKHIDHFCP